MIVPCPNCSKKVSDKAPACPFCHAALGAVTESAPDTNEWNERGMTAAKRGLHDEALRCYEEALRLDPRDIYVWYNKGNLFMARRDYAAALACYDRAVEIEPEKLPHPWVNRGICLSNLGRSQEAVESYDRAIALEPNQHAVWTNKANDLNKLYRHEEALACAERAIVLAPAEANAWNNKGLALEGMGEFAAALAAFERALRLAPNHDAAPGNLLRVSKLLAAKPVSAPRRDVAVIDDSLGADAALVSRSGPPIVAPATAPPLGSEAGSIIGQKYEVVRRLGEGGFGTVYLVNSLETQTLLALKTIRSEYLAHPETREMFKKEAAVWIGLDRHPHLVRAYFFDELDGRFYIGMEYMAGDENGHHSLCDRLQSGPPPLALTLRWGIELCYGMEYAGQRGVRCHRDLKPANILLSREGSIKVTDFGLVGGLSTAGTVAGAAGPPGQTQRGRGFGTPTHMPPEQFVDAASCDVRSDVYAAGVILFELVTGRLPFLADLRAPGDPAAGMAFWSGMQALHREAPVPRTGSVLDPIIARCMAKRPEDRYPRFEALRADLERLLQTTTGERVRVYREHGLAAWEWNNKGISLNDLGRHRDALQCFKKALDLDANSAIAMNNLGLALYHLGEPQKAVSCIEQSLAIAPRVPAALNNLGLCRQALGDHAAALLAFDDALAEAPEMASAWNNRGVSLHAAGRDEEAVTSFDRALALNPTAQAWSNKGVALEVLGRHDAAAACFAQALSLDPFMATAWRNQGLCATAMGRYDEALRCHDKSIEVGPAEAYRAWIDKADVYLALGSRGKAVEALRASLALAPRCAEAREKLERLTTDQPEGGSRS